MTELVIKKILNTLKRCENLRFYVNFCRFQRCQILEFQYFSSFLERYSKSVIGNGHLLFMKGY